MKRFILVIMVFGALVFTGSALAPQGKADSGKEEAVVAFKDKVKLLEVMLQGKYLFEHDDKRMERGDACMYVYTYSEGKAGDLVISFHCQPVVREVSTTTVTNVVMTGDPDVFELKAIQFAGSNKVHLILDKEP